MVFQVLSNSNPSIWRSTLYKNICFSAIHRLHLPVDVEKVLALFKMLQSMLKSAFLFISLHFTYILAEGRRLYVVLFEGRFVLVVSGLE